MKKNTTPPNYFQGTLDRLQGYLKYLVILVVILLTLSLLGNISKTRGSLKTIEDKKEELLALEEKNKELKENLERVKSDEFIEKQIRDQLGLAKSGEIILVLPEDDVLKKLVPEMSVEEEDLPDPIWRKWYKLFF